MANYIGVPFVTLLLTVLIASCNGISSPLGATRATNGHLRQSKAPISYSYRDAHIQHAEAVSSTENCDTLLTEDEKDEIAAYQDDANRIIEAVTNGKFKGATYQELANFVDLHPVRSSGFDNLEKSIDYMMDRMTALGLENVRGEQVLVPHWVRGEETAELLSPYRREIKVLGLGDSVGTPDEGITANVIVVKSRDDLEAKKDQVRGKIVVYNQGWLGSYGGTNSYRGYGASWAAEHGAVAALIESITPFSLNTPHTGGQIYWDNVTHIPAACITREDADYLSRLYQQNQPLQIHLRMLDFNMPLTTSRNVIGELPGAEKGHEYVAVTGHIDCWDVGVGAMDDGSGVVVSVMALAVLKDLGLRPRRTLQAILWTAEEMGLWGADHFAKQHKDILANYSAAFEADFGVFKPKGLDFSGSEKAGCIVNEVLKLTASINTTEYNRFLTPVGSDISILEGVPGLNLNTENDNYFWYHHSEGDTMSMIDSTELDLNTALWAVSSYVLSSIENMLYREPAN